MVRCCAVIKPRRAIAILPRADASPSIPSRGRPLPGAAGTAASPGIDTVHGHGRPFPTSHAAPSPIRRQSGSADHCGLIQGRRPGGRRASAARTTASDRFTNAAMAAGDQPRTSDRRRARASSSMPHGRSTCWGCSAADTPTAVSACACSRVKRCRAATASRALLLSASEGVPARGGARSAGMSHHHCELRHPGSPHLPAGLARQDGVIPGTGQGGNAWQPRVTVGGEPRCPRSRKCLRGAACALAPRGGRTPRRGGPPGFRLVPVIASGLGCSPATRWSWPARRPGHLTARAARTDLWVVETRCAGLGEPGAGSPLAALARPDLGVCPPWFVAQSVRRGRRHPEGTAPAAGAARRTATCRLSAERCPRSTCCWRGANLLRSWGA